MTSGTDDQREIKLAGADEVHCTAHTFTVASGSKISGGGALTIDNASGDITIDAAGDILLDADDTDILLRDGGTTFGGFKQVSNGLQISGGTTPSIVADANGHVTMPAQTAFYANVSRNYNPGTDGNHTVTYATEVYDVNADYNNSNYTFTAPVTGKYLISTAVRGYDVDATWSLAHSIVTSNRTYHNNTTRGQQDQYISTIVVVADMDASDTAYIQINANESAFQISGDTYSYFTAALVC